MESMKKVEFKIVGIARILFDRYHGLPDPKTQDGYKKQSIEKLYLNENNEICIPTSSIKAAIRNACSELGKKMDGKKNRQSVKAGVFFEKELLSTGKIKPDGIQEDVVTRGKGDKVTRVITYRPYLDKWEVSGIMNLFMIEPKFVNESMQLAGVRYGLCGYRPEYGRFIVKQFEVMQ